MLLLLWIACSSALPECVAPLQLVDPPKGYEAVHVQLLTRHGARTPTKAYLSALERGVWLCDAADAHAPNIEAVPEANPRRVHKVLDYRTARFPPNCDEGELLTTGMDQHYQLGKLYSDYLINTLKVLPETLDPERIFVRASAYERTYKSALSFMDGLYKPTTMNELITITTGSKSADVLVPSYDACSELSDIYRNYTASEAFITWKTQARATLTPLFEYLGVNSTSASILHACDWAINMRCNNQDLPSILTEDMISSCYEAYSRYTIYAFEQRQGVAGSYTVREMMRIADQALNRETSVNFALLSAHDTTIAAVLNTLGVNLAALPPFASHLSMEIYRSSSRYFARFVMNGEEVPLPYFGNATLVNYNELREYMLPMSDHCHEFP